MSKVKKPIAHDLDDETKEKTSDVKIEENLNFDEMLLSERVLKGLKKAGFKKPSPIQLKAIPPARCGVDLIVQAKSGTGKTCVFVVAALETVVLSNVGTQVLILAPTREIARQSYETLLAVGSCMPDLKCKCFIGGITQKTDKIAAKQCHIVVGSPGRVCQLIKDGDLSIDGVRLFVLDEADKLMDDSYQENVNWIYSQLPLNKQILVLSATFPRQLDEFLSKYMKTPQHVKLDSTDVQLIGIKQYVFTVANNYGEDFLLNKINRLHSLLANTTFSQCLIFCNFQNSAESLCERLKERQWQVEFIAAQLSQSQRLSVMSRLKKFQCRILVSTDLTARGIDAEHVNFVVNFDVPFNSETYFHRIGRAGRFGGYGAAVTILSGWQNELNFYKMAADESFRVKRLPDTFPLDVVANEAYYENLPPLDVPDLAAYERKASIKLAKKNAPIPSEDLYSRIMKDRRIVRVFPDSSLCAFNFVETVDGVVQKKYDRESMFDVLNIVLGEPNKRYKDKNELAKNNAKGEKKKKSKKDFLVENGLVNGAVNMSNEEDVRNVPEKIENSSKDVTELDKNEPCTKTVVENGVQDFEMGKIVAQRERVIEKAATVVLMEKESMTGGYEKHDNEVENDMADNLEHPPNAESVNRINEVRDDKVAKVLTCLDEEPALSKLNVKEADLSQSAENCCFVAEKSSKALILEVEEKLPQCSDIKEEPKDCADEPLISTSRAYFEAFTRNMDDYYCHLYGGFSWHYERAKLLRSKGDHQPHCEEAEVAPTFVDKEVQCVENGESSSVMYSREQLMRMRMLGYQENMFNYCKRMLSD